MAPGASPTLEGLYILDGDASAQDGYHAGTLVGDHGAGSGIFAEGTSGGSDTITIRNCVIEGNAGGDVWYGGGVYLRYRNNATLADNVIRKNAATAGGGGVHVAYSTNVLLENNDVAANDGGRTTSGGGGGGGVHIEWSDNPRLTGNRVYDNAAAGDYHLCSPSAAIDQGVNAGVSTDFDGQARPYGAGFDVGADEWSGEACTSGVSGRVLDR